MTQVAHHAVGTDPRGPQLRKRLPHMLERTLEDLQDVFQRLVGLALATFEMDLEQRDRSGELGGDAIVQLARDTRTLARHSVFDGLLRKRIVPALRPRPFRTQRAAAPRLMKD